MHIKTLKNIPKQIPELPVQGYISQRKKTTLDVLSFARI